MLGPKLTQLGEQLSGLTAVAVVSAHWQTPGVQVMRTPKPETVHDFGGFPPALYRLQYPAPGAPALASDTAALLEAAGFDVSFDDGRGLDHGVWVPMLYLLPAARIPVFQVSLPVALDAENALKLGRALKDLRQQGVLVMGSGSLTHNLREIGQTDPNNTRYALEFTAWPSARIPPKNIFCLCWLRSEQVTMTTLSMSSRAA